MLKMLIQMDDNKITAEQKYPLDGIYTTIDRVFLAAGLPRVEDASGALVYRDCGRDRAMIPTIPTTLTKRTCCATTGASRSRQGADRGTNLFQGVEL